MCKYLSPPTGIYLTKVGDLLSKIALQYADSFSIMCQAYIRLCSADAWTPLQKYMKLYELEYDLYRTSNQKPGYFVFVY